MSEAESPMIEAFNGLGDVIDFLDVLDMALASEDGADLFSVFATVNHAAKLRAVAAREAARRALDLCKRETRA